MSIKVKLALLTSLIIVLLMGTVAGIFGYRQERTLRFEMRRRAAGVAQIVGSMSLLSSGENRWEISRHFISLMPQLEENLLFLTIIDTAGRPVAWSLNPGLLPVAETEKLRSNLSSGKIPDAASLLPVEVELSPGGTREGTLYVGFSLVGMKQEILRARLIGAGLTFGFIVVGVGGAALLAGSITRPIRRLIGAMGKVRGGDLSVEVPVASEDEVGQLAQSFNFMTAGLRERERIKGTFKRYVSHQIAEKILAGDVQVVVTGERRLATILFSDIRDFTTIAERMSPEEVVAMLNGYFSVMIDIIFEHEGTLDKFIGDAVMAVFGTPVAHPDDPVRAVRTAVKMQQALQTLNRQWEESGRKPLRVGIGIATGEVVAGNIGSDKRMEYTVIGDYVNLASRLSGKGSGILICSRTLAALEKAEVLTEFEVRSVGRVEVKGKLDQVEAYEVLF